MKHEKDEIKPVRELNLTSATYANPLVDFTDGGDFAVSNHFADIVGDDIVKSQMNIIILCSKGTLQANLNGKDEILQANEILICPSHSFVNHFRMEPGCEAKAMCLSDRLVYTMLGDKLDIWIKTVYINNITKLHLTDTESNRLAYYCLLSRSIIDDADAEYKADLVRTQLEAMMLELCSKLSAQSEGKIAKASYSKMLFYKFLKSLSSAPVKRKPVKAYAEELAITPKYLSFVCDKYSGCTALEWIDKFVMEDARYYLKGSEMSIKEIATKLGFPNNSFFGRYVVRHVGMSPVAYRRYLNR